MTAIDAATRKVRPGEPAIDTVEKGLRTAQAAEVPVDLEGAAQSPPASALAVMRTGFGPESVPAREPVPSPKPVPAVSPLGRAAAAPSKAGGRGRPGNAEGATYPKSEEDERVQTKERPGHTPELNLRAESQITSRRGVVSPFSIQRSPDQPAGGCGLCYGEGPGKVGPRDAGLAAHKAIQNELAPKGITDELPWGNGKIDLAVVRPPPVKQIAIAEIKPANERGIDDGIKQIEARLRLRPKLREYAGYKWVKLNEPVGKRIRFETKAPVCPPPYLTQPGFCYSHDLSVAGPVGGLLYLYFCEPSYSELLTGGCSCACKEPGSTIFSQEPKEKKRKDKEPKDKEPGPSGSLPGELLKLGGELLPILAVAGLLDIALAMAGVLGPLVSSPLVALAAVVLGIAFFWDKLEWLGSKAAGMARWVWDKIAGLADWVRGKLTWILGKLSELGIKLAELGSWLAGKIAWLAGKLAEGLTWIAGKIAAGGSWVGRKVASAAEAIWDWLTGSNVEPMAPNIDMPAIEETSQHCATVAYDDTIIKLDADLLFPFNEWELRKEADAPLDAAAQKIRRMLQKDDWIKFEGYTDNIGSDKYNQTLSEQRAGAVASWFVEHGVVPMSRVRTEGYGKKMARANDDEGRKKDRRVEILLPEHGGTKTVCW